MTPPSRALVYTNEPPHASIQVQKSGQPEEILSEIERMYQADKMAEARKIKLAKVGGLALILGFMTFFIGAVAEIYPLPIVGGVLFGLGIIVFIVRGIVGRADVDDRKLDVVRHLVHSLAPELKNRPVQLSLNFRGYEKTKPLEDTTGFFNSTGVKVFKQTWLDLSFVLADGTSVRMEASESCKRKQRAKRKYTKRKDKTFDDLTITYRPGKGKSLDPTLGQRVPSAMKRMNPRLIRAQVKPKAAQFQFRTTPSQRLCGRGGWSQPSGIKHQLHGHSALAAVITSYRMLASSTSGAQ